MVTEPSSNCHSLELEARDEYEDEDVKSISGRVATEEEEEASIAPRHAVWTSEFWLLWFTR